MAGKTFPGIGDLEDEVPPLDPADAADSSDHSQSNYSGPTVVDDVKVEQGLKKLRSLDTPLGPLTGIDQAIVDVLDDPPRGPPEITIDPARGTAVGRSVSGPVGGQQTTAPVDDRALRGTMFGHGVHLPDLEEARRLMQVETSKALAVVERGVATTNEITVFQPGTYPPHADIPRAQEPHPRSSRSQAHDTPIELRTVLPRNTLVLRVAATGAGIAAIVVAALFWVRSTDEADLNARTPVANPVLRAPKPVEVQPLVPPPTPSAPVAPALAPTAPVPAPHAAAVAPTPVPPTDVETAAETRANRASSPAEPTGRHTHGSSRYSERHHSPAASEAAAAGAAKPDEGSKPERTERPTRAKRPVEDDPDGTMAPTIE
jgi:hypothetical protein